MAVRKQMANVDDVDEEVEVEERPTSEGDGVIIRDLLIERARVLAQHPDTPMNLPCFFGNRDQFNLLKETQDAFKGLDPKKSWFLTAEGLSVPYLLSPIYYSCLEGCHAREMRIPIHAKDQVRYSHFDEDVSLEETDYDYRKEGKTFFVPAYSLGKFVFDGCPRCGKYVDLGNDYICIDCRGWG